MHTGRQDQNGHRRRELAARIKATATHCALCGHTLNPAAKWPAPDATVIDEDIPRARGGNPLDPANTNALHNICNRWKSTMTLHEARVLIAQGANINEPITRAQRLALTHPTTGTWSPTSSHW